MIEIIPTLFIDERELGFDFIRASGPGGQNVNKVATAVQLRFDIQANRALSDDTKARLIKLGGSRVTSNGILIIEAKQYRTQEKNKEDATARFVALIRKSLEKPKPRHKTKPSRAAVEKRIESKKKRGKTKKLRRGQSFE